MKISVIIPSRLAINPASPTDRLYLGRAIQSATDFQSIADDVDFEVIAGLDPGGIDKAVAIDRKHGGGYIVGPRLKLVEAKTAGQAAAVNAAVAASTGDVIAMIEDDDIHQPRKLETQLPLLADYDIVTCNQREADEWGNFVRVNCFATPSGWLMSREAWDRVGGFDESYRWHVDTEWLGRANRAGLKRGHVLPCTVDLEDPWLTNVRRWSRLVIRDEITEPLVNRTVNEEGGMALIRRDAEAKRQSDEEHERMRQANGGQNPW